MYYELSLVGCLSFKVFHGVRVKLAIRNVVASEPVGRCPSQPTQVVVILELISCHLPFVRINLISPFHTPGKGIRQWCEYLSYT